MPVPKRQPLSRGAVSGGTNALYKNLFTENEWAVLYMDFTVMSTPILSLNVIFTSIRGIATRFLIDLFAAQTEGGLNQLARPLLRQREKCER